MSLSQRNRRRRRSRGGGANKVLLALVVVVSAGVIAGLSAVGYVVSIAASAPPLSSLKPRDPGSFSIVYARDGQRLGVIEANDLRRPIPFSQIPKVMQDATVAIEDERYYRHRGVDYEGVIRAAVKNLTSRKTVQGGSTISMQLVRNLYGQKERTYKRKIREAKLAEELENEHPGQEGKQWILSEYINTVPYGTVGGQSAIGVWAAAKIYFNKPPERLKLHEAAMLAGLPQAPSDYSPIRNPGAALQRRNDVIDKMADLGMVSEAEAAEAKGRDLGLAVSRYFQRRRESYFFDYVKDQLFETLGVKEVRAGGLRVHTTLDLKKQRAAKETISANLAGIGPSSAVVTINPANGEILTMASSADYGKSKFNLAAQGHRQPGSAFKIMALMTALRRGIDPNTTSYNGRSPLEVNDPAYGKFKIQNYGNSSRGTMNLVQATLGSVNSVYIQLAMDLGPQEVKQTAYDMGIETKLDGYPAETLGGLTIGVSPLEMATAYATIANGGWRRRPIAITSIRTRDGKVLEGNTLPPKLRPKARKVFPDGVTYEATKILVKNIQGGTGGRANIGCPAGGKTGTTDKNSDAWFVGFTPRLATAVWVGYPNAQIYMTSEFQGGPVDGGTFPAKIWGEYMKRAKGGFCGDFRQPRQPMTFTKFFGKYSRTAVPSSSATPGATANGNGGAEAPENKKGSSGKGNGKGYDPAYYESQPQGAPTAPPATQEPAPAPADPGGAVTPSPG